MKQHFIIKPEGLPNLAGMMFSTLEALRELGGSGNLHEIDERVIENECVSEEEQSYTVSGREGRPKVNYYLSWARTYLRLGGAIKNSARGVWALTEAGNKITAYTQAKAIFDQVCEERKGQRKEKKSELLIDDSETPIRDEQDVPWRESLLNVLREIKADAFERLSQRLLREVGFTKVEVRGKVGDGGIDGVGVLRVNLVSFQVYFQCKRWKGSVGAKEIRDFRGALQGRADKGLFITTGHFTTQASEEATREGAIAIDLIDGNALCDLLKLNGLGVTTELVEAITVDANWFDGI